MHIFRARSLVEACEIKAAHPDAVPIAGGTDVMVELNLDHARPPAILDLGGVGELKEWESGDGRLRVGAGVTYTQVMNELGKQLPGLAAASRTVGSVQIRNRGTVGGNLGSASPAGDALPLLYACDAEVEVVGAQGTRMIPIGEFIIGPKRNALRPDELIAAFHVEAATGPQQFSKIGTRNAMVIAVCSLGLALRPERRAVGVCIGSAGPYPLRVPDAERFIEDELHEDGLWESRSPLRDSVAEAFGERVAAAARPIDDVRGTAAYRRHAVGVLARRALSWAWDEYRKDERRQEVRR